MVSYGCCGLGASIYRSFILDKHIKLISSNETRRSDNSSLRGFILIKINLGKNLTLYCDTISNYWSR